jgi:hypothetical protein
MADFNDWIKHAFGIGPDPDEQMKPPPPGATDAENAPRLPSWSNHEPPEGATMQQVAQAGEDLADEIAEARQRNRRTAEFATKMGAPVTRNPVRFERDSRKQQAVAYLRSAQRGAAQGAVQGAGQTISLKDDVTMTDPKDEAAFQAWKKKYAHPQDDGEDYDLRGAWRAGLKPGPDGHWPDTFKRPNHTTFSNESKYAGNEGARPGRWEGEEFIPYAGPGTDAYQMRDGSSDPRTNSFDKNFRRDSSADQARVKRGYEDAAGRQADALMAQYQTQMATPSAVAARIEDQNAQEDVQRRLLAIEWLRGGR